MKEQFLGNSRQRFVAGEKMGFRPQMETLRNFMDGKNPEDNDRLRMSVNGRIEFWKRNETRFADGQVKIVSIGAHPDDTALSTGLEHVLVKKGRKNGQKNTRLTVITATDGQLSGIPNLTPEEIGARRIEEDIQGTKRLGADMLINLGFSDRGLEKDFDKLTGRLTHYLQALDADIIMLPDPEDLVHPDHVAVAKATLLALENIDKKPLVVYSDFQRGDSEITPDHIGFALTETDHGVFSNAYLDHESQTYGMSPDVEQVLRRPTERAKILKDPTVPYLGVARADSPFAKLLIEELLQDSVVQLPSEETIVYSRIPALK